MKNRSSNNKSFRRIVLLLIAIALSLPITAQTGEKRIDLAIKRQSLNSFIKTLEKKSGFTFIYGEEVKLSHPISVKMKNATISEILSAAFASEAISYHKDGQYIILKKKEAPKVEKQEKSAKRRFTIHGYITDGQSHETLIGANIFEKFGRIGTSTNPYGYYSITLPEGKTNLDYSYIGYATTNSHFELRRDTLINIRLESYNELPGVTVVSDKSESGIRATQMGAIDIPLEQIKGTPALLGEADILKTIQLMPGVQGGTEGATGIYVRGGNADQNLILLDGIPLYRIDHLFGFFSIFSPEAVKKVTLFKGSFPARFGGRLSSVIDIRTNDGDMQNFHGGVSIGTLTAKVHAEGPIKKDKTSFLFSSRRTWLDFPSFIASDNNKVGYYFYDINAKINHRFSDKDRLYISMYTGKDHCQNTYHEIYNEGQKDYGEEKYGSNINWGNFLLWGRWNHVFGNKLFANTTVAHNHYFSSLRNFDNNYNSSRDIEYSSHYKSEIKDWNVQIDFDYNPLPTHHIKFGANYTYHAFHPEVMNSNIRLKADALQSDTTVTNLSNSVVYAHEASIYAEDNWQIGDRLSLNYGITPSMFSVSGKSYFSLQPRLSARYQLNNAIALKAAYTNMGQYIHLLTSLPIALPTDLWVPVTKRIKPMSADQFSFGTYFTGLKRWEFSAEVYYKKMKNVLEYKDGTAYYGSSSGWEDKVEMGKGRSYGIEFLLQKTEGKSTGWLSYTLSKSDRKFDKGGINDGERFPFTYDRRHHITLVFNHQFKKSFDVHASWEFYSGGMATLAEKQTELIDGSEAGYVPHRNNYRLPSSHTLCLGCNFYKRRRHCTHTFSISVYNAYNAMNPTFTLRDTDNDDEPSRTTPRLQKFTLLPFIPSFTYSFNF